MHAKDSNPTSHTSGHNCTQTLNKIFNNLYPKKISRYRYNFLKVMVMINIFNYYIFVCGKTLFTELLPDKKDRT